MKIDLRPYAQRPLNQIKHRVYCCTDGKTYEGFFRYYIQANDNDPEEDALFLYPTKDAKNGWCLFESDIERIEPIE